MEYHTVKLMQTKGYPIASVRFHINGRGCVSAAAQRVHCTQPHEKVFGECARQVLTR